MQGEVTLAGDAAHLVGDGVRGTHKTLGSTRASQTRWWLTMIPALGNRKTKLQDQSSVQIESVASLGYRTRRAGEEERGGGRKERRER